MIGWIDLIVSIYLTIFFIAGLKKDFFPILTNLISLMLSFAISIFVYKQGSHFLMLFFPISEPFANVLGFFFTFLVLKILIQLPLRKFLAKLKPKTNKQILNKIASGIASYFLGIFTIFLFFSIIASLSLPYIIDKELQASSTGKIINENVFETNDYFEKIFGNILTAATSKLDFLTISDGEESKIKNLNFKTSQYRFSEEMEKEMLALINTERIEIGLDPLIIDEKMRETARKHGADMLENGYFSHTNLRGENITFRMRNDDIKFNFSGENLALSKNLFSAHEGLMLSPGHRKNILHLFFHRIGIGAVDAGPYGIIFVQNFAD